MACASSEDSDQPGHPPSLIRAFAVRMKKAWVLSYPLSVRVAKTHVLLCDNGMKPFSKFLGAFAHPAHLFLQAQVGTPGYPYLWKQRGNKEASAIYKFWYPLGHMHNVLSPILKLLTQITFKIFCFQTECQQCKELKS